VPCSVLQCATECCSEIHLESVQESCHTYLLQCVAVCCSERHPEHVNESSCAYGYSAPLMLQSVAVTGDCRDA